MTLIPQVDLPDGKVGNWEIDHFTIGDEPSIARLRLAMDGRDVSPGTYTRLCYKGRVVMSDTPAEVRDHRMFVAHAAHATGRVLITGLGLGMIANACLMKGVPAVDIIEIDNDVISLVAPHWIEKWGERFNVIHANALTWTPPKDAKWDAAWHDIWPAICADNLPDMHKLHRKFGRRVSGYHASWCRWECERARRESARWSSQWRRSA